MRAGHTSLGQMFVYRQLTWLSPRKSARARGQGRSLRTIENRMSKRTLVLSLCAQKFEKFTALKKTSDTDEKCGQTNERAAAHRSHDWCASAGTTTLPPRRPYWKMSATTPWAAKLHPRSCPADSHMPPWPSLVAAP